MQPATPTQRRRATPGRSTLTAPNTTINSSPADPSNDTRRLHLQLHRRRLDLRVPRRQRQLDVRAPAPHTLAGTGRRQPHLRRARHRRSRQHRRHAGQLHLDDRPHRAEHDDRLQPGRPVQRHDAELQLQLLRSAARRFECRVDGGSWTSCTSPESISPALTRAATPSRCAPPTRPATPTPHPRATPGRSTSRPRTPRSTPTRPTRPTTRPRASRSAPRRPAPASSAASTAAAGRPAPAPRPISPALTAGSHTFDVRATDAAGNTDATPASHTWTIDLTPPNTTIDSSPSSPSGNTTPTFAFSSSEGGSSFECRIDGGGWSSCTSPDTISPALGEGSHTFDVRAIDPAGNADATPAGHTWLIDTGAPTVTITDPTSYLNAQIPTTTP